MAKFICKSLILLYFYLLSSASFAAPSSDAEWFNVKPGNFANWEFTYDATENHVEIILANDLATTEKRTRPKKILVVYAKKSKAYDTALSKLLSVFSEKNMNVGFRIILKDKENSLLEKKLSSAEEDGFSLIMAMGSNSVISALEVYTNGSLPVLTICAKDPVLMKQVQDYDSGSGNNFAFTSLNTRAEAIFDYIKLLKPSLTNIGILYAEQNSSAVKTQFLPMQALSASYGVNVVGLGVKDRSKSADELRLLIPEAISQMSQSDPDLKESLLWITGSTSIMNEIELIDSLAGNVPILSAATDVVSAGDISAVLSIGVGFETNAHLAAIYAVDILNGDDTRVKPVGVVNPPDIAINFLKAREIGMKIPFSFFEIASVIYNGQGRQVRP